MWIDKTEAKSTSVCFDSATRNLHDKMHYHCKDEALQSDVNLLIDFLRDLVASVTESGSEERKTRVGCKPAGAKKPEEVEKDSEVLWCLSEEAKDLLKQLGYKP